METTRIVGANLKVCALRTLLLTVVATQKGYSATGLTAHAETAQKRASSVDFPKKKRFLRKLFFFLMHQQDSRHFS